MSDWLLVEVQSSVGLVAFALVRMMLPAMNDFACHQLPMFSEQQARKLRTTPLMGWKLKLGSSTEQWM